MLFASHRNSDRKTYIQCKLCLFSCSTRHSKLHFNSYGTEVLNFVQSECKMQILDSMYFPYICSKFVPSFLFAVMLRNIKPHLHRGYGHLIHHKFAVTTLIVCSLGSGPRWWIIFELYIAYKIYLRIILWIYFTKLCKQVDNFWASVINLNNS